MQMLTTEKYIAAGSPLCYFFYLFIYFLFFLLYLYSDFGGSHLPFLPFLSEETIYHLPFAFILKISYSPIICHSDSTP